MVVVVILCELQAPVTSALALELCCVSVRVGLFFQHSTLPQHALTQALFLPSPPLPPADLRVFTPWTKEEQRTLCQLVAQHTQVGRGELDAVLSVPLAALPPCPLPATSDCRLQCLTALSAPCPPLLQPSGRVKWAAVAAGLPGRTDKQCASHYANTKDG